MKVKVFISYKNRDDNSSKTPEAAIAERLYKRLNDEGISVFYSNISLLDFGESVYKDAIDKALDEADVLIVIGSSAENLNSRWVKYEWSSFHEDILAGDKPNGVIIPYVHSGLERKDRPRSLRNLETFCYDTDGDEKIIAFLRNTLKKNNAPESSEKETFGQTEVSSYSPIAYYEHDRLKIQAQNTREADMPALRYILSKKGDAGLKVLDLGCAYGYVTEDRFRDVADKTVIAVDRSAECIDWAKERSGDESIRYYCLDIETRDFEKRLSAIMQENGVDRFDLIFSTLVLHHLKDPIKLLMRVRKFLRSGGYILLRGSDDGSVVSYNDQGIVQKIIEKHLKTPGISDRLNGRKLYYQLYTSGYRDIRMFNYVKDIAGKSFDERHDIFEERFVYRRNYIANQVKKDPSSMELRNELGWMDFALRKLEELFGNDSFWYQEIDFVAVARKSG